MHNELSPTTAFCGFLRERERGRKFLKVPEKCRLCVVVYALGRNIIDSIEKFCLCVLRAIESIKL
jgi:hypothetical protein